MQIATIPPDQYSSMMSIDEHKVQIQADEYEISQFSNALQKNHSTPQRSTSGKQKKLSYHTQNETNNDEMNDLKEYNCQTELLQNKLEDRIEVLNDEQQCRNKQESLSKMSCTSDNAETRKFSTASTEDLKDDNLLQHTKRNLSSFYNLHENRRISNDLNINADYNISNNQINNNYTNLQRQEESKELQQLYQESTEKNKLYEERIRKNIITFGLDKYQHYILELILDIGSLGHKKIIIEKILKEKDSFCYEQFGHKVLNKCIEVSKKEFIDLYPEFIKFIIDRNNKIYQSLQVDKFGNYVIQKCLDVFDNENLSDLLYLLNSTLLIKPQHKLASMPSQPSYKDVDLCSDQYGCLIIQKLIEIYKQKPEGKIKNQVGQMIEKVINDSYRLAQRQFSNYVIQQIIEKGANEHKNLIYSNLISKQFVYLSMDKYGSNVAEKAVIYANSDQKNMIWNMISVNNFSSLLNMANDQYANYVVQRLFDQSSVKEKEQIYEQLCDWNKKNKLKENAKHPFKYIEDKMNQQVFNAMNFNKFQQRYNQNNYNSQNSINTQQYPTQINQQENNFNHNQKISMKKQNVNNNKQYSKQQINQYNQNEFENIQNQRVQSNNYLESKNRNNQQNNFHDQRNFDQNGQQNKNQLNNFQKNYQNSYNNQIQYNNNISFDTQRSIQDENQMKNSRRNNRNINQTQFQNNNYQVQQHQDNDEQNSYGKRNTQTDQNYQSNKQKKYSNNKRTNYNNYPNPYYYPNNNDLYYMQSNYYEYPYYQSQPGYYAYTYPIQAVGYMNPSFMDQIDPNTLLQQSQPNLQDIPILDFLKGPHLNLKSQKQNQQEEQKQETQENTIQDNSQNQLQNQANNQTTDDVNQQDKQKEDTVEQK